MTNPPDLNTALPPADVIACGADPEVPLCPDCEHAYRNGIEPGQTACDARARGEAGLFSTDAFNQMRGQIALDTDRKD